MEPTPTKFQIFDGEGQFRPIVPYEFAYKHEQVLSITMRANNEVYQVAVGWDDAGPFIQAWGPNDATPSEYLGRVELRQELIFKRLGE